MKKYSVYIHTNRINGKKYVGVTRIKPERRWAKGEGYRDNSHFYAAIKKYGWDSFEHFIVEVDTPEKMYELEKLYIKIYETTNQDKGYNQSFCGESGCFKGVNSGSKEYYKLRYNQNPSIYRDRVMKRYYAHRDEINEKRRKKRRKYKQMEDSPMETLW